MTPHDACAGEGCPGCYMTGEVDRWGLSRPRPFFHTFISDLDFLRTDWDRMVTGDVRGPWTRWEHMWHNVGVMWYYDSAWSREGDV